MDRAKTNYEKAKARAIKANKNYRANPNSNTLNAEVMNAANALLEASAALRKAKESRPKTQLQIAKNKLRAAKARMIKANNNYRANPSSNTLNAEAMNAANAFMQASKNLRNAKKPDGLVLITKLFKSENPRKRATEPNKLRFWMALSAQDKNSFLKKIRNPAGFSKVYPKCG